MTAAPRRALLSVYDKTDIVPFAQRLARLGFEILSTGGTFRTLTEAGVPATYVTEATGSPEVFGGRVKTLHPVVHGGILFRRDLPDHVAEAAAHEIVPIDVVAVNLYPFQQTIATPGVTLPDAVEQIDIGGPTMVRAAAKNHAHVAVVVSPSRYDAVASALERGAMDAKLRQQLALEAFRHTATYDAAIASYLSEQFEDSPLATELHQPLLKVGDLRYGENPHQAAALYRTPDTPELGGATVHQGKALSYNNLVDLDAAVQAVAEFEEPAAVIVKHTNPCGVGRDSESLATAYARGLAGDPVSAFGGIVAFNRPVDASLAATLCERFFEVIAAPAFDEGALEAFASKKNLRIVEVPARRRPALVPRATWFGTIVQDADARVSDLAEAWDVVTERAPTDAEAIALAFLWRVCKHVKSNAIVLGTDQSTLGIGAGQMSRVDAVELAVKKATAPLQGAALASDAFFPFRDGVEAAAAAGVRAIIQPGGSVRDEEVIAACNTLGIAMVFTGHRHFRH